MNFETLECEETEPPGSQNEPFCCIEVRKADYCPAGLDVWIGTLRVAQVKLCDAAPFSSSQPEEGAVVH